MRQIEAERNAVGVGQLHLVERPARAEDAQVRNDAAARADERDRLPRGELAFLIKPLEHLEPVPLAEEDLHRLLRQVAVARADIDDERIGRRRGARQRPAQPRIDGLAHQVFHHGAMGRRGLGHGHHGTSFAAPLK